MIWILCDLRDPRDHYKCSKNKLQEESRKGKEDHILLRKGKPHVSDHTIGDDKGVFRQTHKSL